MTSTDTIDALADRLTVAIADSDAEALSEVYTADAIAWHSTDGVELPLPQLLDLVRAIDGIATGEVTVKSRFATEAGFVQTQTNSYSLRDGTGGTTFDAALVAWVDETGRIKRVEEYLDSAGLKPLIEALSPPA
jgi:hypothetical protein